MMYGTVERAEMVAAAKAELSGWTLKALQQTARACGYSSHKLDKKGLVGKLALALVNTVKPGARALPMCAEARANW